MMSLDIQNDYLEWASILDDKYLIIDTIGQGRYAKVKLAVDIEAKQKYAIKIMKTDPTTDQKRLQAFINEVQIQASLEHRHIIKIIQCRIDGQYRKVDGRVSQVSYFVMELADQGELFEIIDQSALFSEKFARNIFQQLIKGLEYLHERGLVHRDIKSENLLFSNGTLKLADFGFSAKIIDDYGSKVLFEVSQHAGSPEYNSPELSNLGKFKYYNPEASDIFAAGVILFTMVMKSAPFKNSKQTDPYYSLLRQDKVAYWQVFSELNNNPTNQFKEFIEKILEENPNKRLTLEQIKKHPWMQGSLHTPTDYQKELKNRYDLVTNKMKSKITYKRETKFSARKAIKRKEIITLPKMVPNYLYESLQIIETINARLIKPQEFKQAQAITIQSKDQEFQQKQKKCRSSEGSKKSSPATPPNDSDN